MKKKLMNLLRSFGGSTSTYAHRVGDRTSALARSVGPKRGGFALGALAAAMWGGPRLFRYLREHRAQRAAEARAGQPFPASGHA
ncbi:MAG TPA: hypothetical protein VIV11_18635 [Kofleriaceae bacterium]